MNNRDAQPVMGSNTRSTSMSSNEDTVCRVLYIEDTQWDQQILREAVVLAAVPIDVVTASTAQSALQLLSDGGDFHVLILDWNLPAVTGLEFLIALRVNQPAIEVIILTGEPRTVDVPTAAKLGATTIVKKPLLLEDWERLATRLYDECRGLAGATSLCGDTQKVMNDSSLR